MLMVKEFTITHFYNIDEKNSLNVFFSPNRGVIFFTPCPPPQMTIYLIKDKKNSLSSLFFLLSPILYNFKNLSVKIAKPFRSYSIDRHLRKNSSFQNKHLFQCPFIQHSSLHLLNKIDIVKPVLTENIAPFLNLIISLVSKWFDMWYDVCCMLPV